MAISIERELIEHAMKISGERSQEAVVVKALQEFIARYQQARLLDLFGKMKWNSASDYKSERGRLRTTSPTL